jgi:hypothetical protein
MLHGAKEVLWRAGDVVHDRTAEARLSGALLPRPEERYDVLVFFSALPAQMYQLRQWYGPLEALAATRSVGIVVKTARIAHVASFETSLPIRFFRYADPCERWMLRSGARLVLYVNQNTQNFQSLRMAAPAHVHLSHGESEKVSMVSNQLKGYDYVFTAGEAARERIQRHLVGMDDSRFHDVGHPQSDIPSHVPDLPTNRARTVLYAPTWEGASESMAYSSVSHGGVDIVTALLNTEDRRVIYRPHPQTGLVSPATRAADGEIRRRIAHAVRADPHSGHVVDVGRDFGWQAAVADECICDVSAVAYEWLISGKPLLIASGAAAATEVGPTIARLPRLPYGAGTDVVAHLDQAAQAADLLASLSAHHFGDTRPGQSLARFIRACDTVIDGRKVALGEL